MNHKFKVVAWIKPFGYLALGYLTAMSPFPPVLAKTPTTNHNHSNIMTRQTALPTQPEFQLAQMGENRDEERTRFIQAADALSSQEKFTEAEEILRKLIERYPKYAVAHYKLGNVLFRQEKAEEAIAAYQQAIEHNSRYALAYNAIGMVRARQGRWQEAITEYQKALEINPEYGEALTHLGQAFWQQGRRDEALASLEKALSIFRSQNRRDQAYRLEQLLRELKSDDDPSVA
ncbi:Tetratricopeptide TPR_1 repeat-containing protein [Gloeocapsa sp. PCC 7428]|uniref:tetratricopeptide repeat protein n=1 Tax=Gloeocapsa sp. PCC 7428 TaxID=1173026 RepID=UPI0002A5DE6D|nr:tetratricopeptide repeat protein [Gloeocapsa sp. PCC 7428]AFZ28900.1 Tetratricopeptide TPR_1 repeat-containing protein [Gloeocapsa sp. PCC 7428]